MKKKLISEELVDVSKLTLNNLDTTAIKNVKTNNGLLTDIDNAAKSRNQIVTIGSSNGNTVSITKFSDSINPNMEVSKLVEDVNPNSDYNRVKYFTDSLKNSGYSLNSTGDKVITWGNGKMDISKKEEVKTEEKPKTDSKTDNENAKQNDELSQAREIVKGALTPDLQSFQKIAKQKSVQTESLVKEEINRIKQLMK